MSPFHQFLEKVQDAILTPIITLLALGAFVIFLWGLLQFMLAMQGGSIGTGDKKENNPGISAGKSHMIWGIIGLVIIFGANAIVSLIKATVGAP